MTLFTKKANAYAGWPLNGSLSIRTDVKDLSVTKTDGEQICFGFLCYFTSIK